MTNSLTLALSSWPTSIALECAPASRLCSKKLILWLLRKMTTFMFALWLIFQIECRKSIKGHEILASLFFFFFPHWVHISGQGLACTVAPCRSLPNLVSDNWAWVRLPFSPIVVNFGKHYLAGCDAGTVLNCASSLVCFPGGAAFHLWPRMRLRESLPRAGCKTCLLWPSYCLSVYNYRNYSFPFPSLPRPARCA